MSDFGSGQQLPPPPSTAPLPPPPQAMYAAPPGYAPYQVMTPQKPPRPPVVAGSWLLIVGALVIVAGTLLKWYTIAGIDFNGFKETFDPDTGEVTTNTGGVFVFFAVLSLGFGIAQLAAKRVLAVAILAVVFGSFAALAALGEMSNISDRKSFMGGLVPFETGPGIYVVIAGSVVALAGAITTLSRRRR